MSQLAAVAQSDTRRSQMARQSVLPEAPPFWSRQVFGPSAVFTALAIGSGELIFWPGLSLPYGAGVLWIALIAVAIQYVMNIEIGRYSLATGESVVVGATRLWRGWGWILLVGTVLPWLWPGWARAGSQVLAGAFGIAEKPVSIISLVLCGLLLAAPKRVYSLVEGLQTFLLVFILLGVFGLFAIVLGNTNSAPSGGFWSAFFMGDGIGTLLGKSVGAKSADFFALLGGVVFAGAGGILNLGYGLMLCEKGFAMGTYAQPIVGIRHSLGLHAASDTRPEIETGPETMNRWRRWIRLSRQEHALLFVGGNSFTIVFLSLIFFSLLGRSTDAQGMAFLQTATQKLADNFGSGTSLLFVAVAYVILFTSEIGIIDVTSRLAAGIICSLVNLPKSTASVVYHAIVWTEIVFGIVLTLADPRQPYWFLVTSGILNTAVMAVYTALVAELNRKKLPAMLRPHRLSTAVLWAAAIVYGGFFVLTLTRL